MSDAIPSPEEAITPRTWLVAEIEDRKGAKYDRGHWREKKIGEEPNWTLLALTHTHPKQARAERARTKGTVSRHHVEVHVKRRERGACPLLSRIL